MKPPPPRRCNSALLALLALLGTPALAQPGKDAHTAPPDPEAVVEPPRTGNEEMVKKPANVDPKIDDATPGIDRKRREATEDKVRKDKKRSE